MNEDMRPSEIARSLDRIEKSLERIELTIGQHETSIAVLKQDRSTVAWMINGLWALLLAGVEWWLHGGVKH